MDVTGLPVGALVAPASMHENATTGLMLEHLAAQGVTDRPDLVLVDRGVTSPAATRLGRRYGVEVRRVGWDNSNRRCDPAGADGRSVAEPVAE